MTKASGMERQGPELRNFKNREPTEQDHKAYARKDEAGSIN